MRTACPSCGRVAGRGIGVSPKIPRAKALVGFSRYRAAQEAARYEERLKLEKTGCFLSSTVCELCRLAAKAFVPAPKADISLAVIHKVAEWPAPPRHSSSSKFVNNCAPGEILAGGRWVLAAMAPMGLLVHLRY
jgi:hypothetical protein